MTLGDQFGILKLAADLRELDRRRGEPVPMLEYLAVCKLADGRFIGLLPLLAGQGRIVEFRDKHGIDRGWCYEHLHQAIAAYQAWDPVQQIEPEGWARAIPIVAGGFRRRPAGGDASTEYLLE